MLKTWKDFVLPKDLMFNYSEEMIMFSFTAVQCRAPTLRFYSTY